MAELRNESLMYSKKNSLENPDSRKPGNGSSLTVGYFWTFGSTALPLVGAFVASLLIARWMGPRAAGLINWAMALATILLIPAKFGIDGAASRMVSGYSVSEPELIGPAIRTGLLMRLLFTVPVSLITVVSARHFAIFFGEEALEPLFRISALLILAVSINELTALLAVGLKRFRLLFLMRAVMFVLRTGLVAGVIYATAGPGGILSAYTAAAFFPAILIFSILLAGYRSGSFFHPERSIWKKMLRLSAPLAISGASVTIYSLLDKLMLGYFHGATPVGIYSIARNLLETSLFPTFALIMILRPALAGRWAAGDLKGCRSLIDRSILNSVFYSVCVITVFSCLSMPLITGLFSIEFAGSAKILLMFLPLILMRGIGSVILPGLIAADRADTYAKLTVTGAVLNFLLNLALIPKYGANGAVVSTLLSYLPVEILGLRALWKVLPGFWKKGNWSRVVRCLITGCAVVLAYRSLIESPDGLFPAIVHAIAIVLVFTGGLVLNRAITMAEIRETMAPLFKSGR
jgi:O-antigen/teichoic acid export membrane protein